MTSHPTSFVRADALECDVGVTAPAGAGSVEEQALVARVRVGDAAAFEALFRAHYRGIRAFLLHYVRSGDAADELLQDLFLRLWADRARWEVAGSVRTYLYQAARNRALNHLRHTRIETRHRKRTLAERASAAGLGREWAERRDSDAWVPPALTAATPADDMEARELADRARAIVTALPERCRTVYTLKQQHGLSYNEIATVMEISPHTVAAHMEHAFKRLRRGLAPFLVSVIVAVGLAIAS